jgi:undecaprenyl phosphate-alpha-L-ara4FN deformylase
LPTFDEVIGSRIHDTEISLENYNQYILSLLDDRALNVYTIHAEVEGIIMAPLFESFIISALEKGIHFCPLSELLPAEEVIPVGKVSRGTIAGREGWLGCQV